MKTLLIFFCLMIALLFGFKTGKKERRSFMITQSSAKEEEFPIKIRKTFVFVVYAYNQGQWVDRTLRSIFEQEYDFYRIIFIDDASKDNTFVTARDFILENNQETRTLMIRNEEKLGYLTCLYQVAQSLLDQEIIIPIHAKDWLAHSGALTRMNSAFQNPDVWIASTSGIKYPSYERIPIGFEGFYAALFKQLPASALVQDEKGAKDPLAPLRKLSTYQTKNIGDILLISNATSEKE